MASETRSCEIYRSPTTFFLLITMMIRARQVFDSVAVMTRGGSAGHGMERPRRRLIGHLALGFGCATSYGFLAKNFSSRQKRRQVVFHWMAGVGIGVVDFVPKLALDGERARLYGAIVSQEATMKNEIKGGPDS